MFKADIDAYEYWINNSNSVFYFHVTVPSRYLQWLSCIVTWYISMHFLIPVALTSSE
jgi:hypothetical protein